MTKKLLWPSIGIITIAFLVVGMYYFVRNVSFKKTEEKGMLTSPTPTVTPKVEQTTWNDPAGFSFSYLKDMQMNTHEEDNENYAHIELTHANIPGSIIIYMKDTTASTIEAWIKGNKEFKDKASIDTTFGGNPAKKIMLKDAKNTLITATLDEDVLVFMETVGSDSSYWQDATEIIRSSMVFQSNSAGTTTSGSEEEDALDEGAVDEVETVE